MVARGFELPAQMLQIDIQQLPLPLAHLAATIRVSTLAGPSARRPPPAPGLSGATLSARVEDDDVGLLARRQRARFRIEPEVFAPFVVAYAAPSRVWSGSGTLGGWGGHQLPVGKSRIEDHLVHAARVADSCGAHLGKKSAVSC